MDPPKRSKDTGYAEFYPPVAQKEMAKSTLTWWYTTVRMNVTMQEQAQNKRKRGLATMTSQYYKLDGAAFLGFESQQDGEDALEDLLDDGIVDGGEWEVQMIGEKL